METILISDEQLNKFINSFTKKFNISLSKSLKIAISKLYRKYGANNETMVTKKEISQLLDCGEERASAILRDLEKTGLVTRTIRSHKVGERLIPNCLYLTINL
jgi:DNA-binding MarR family transcriptional regulator